MPRDEQNPHGYPRCLWHTSTIWGVPSESGGKLFVAYITGAEDVKKANIKMDRTKHFSGATLPPLETDFEYGVQDK